MTVYLKTMLNKCNKCSNHTHNGEFYKSSSNSQQQYLVSINLLDRTSCEIYFDVSGQNKQ